MIKKFRPIFKLNVFNFDKYLYEANSLFLPLIQLEGLAWELCKLPQRSKRIWGYFEVGKRFYSGNVFCSFSGNKIVVIIGEKRSVNLTIILLYGSFLKIVINVYLLIIVYMRLVMFIKLIGLCYVMS